MDESDWVIADGADVLIRVKAVAGASREGIAGLVGDRLKVRVAAPAEGGKANRAICRIIAGALGLRPGDVEIERGGRSAAKVLRVGGGDAGQVRSRLGGAV